MMGFTLRFRERYGGAQKGRVVRRWMERPAPPRLTRSLSILDSAGRSRFVFPCESGSLQKRIFANPLVALLTVAGIHKRDPAYLLLEDGRRFDGYRFGAPGPSLGEVVFNTSMTGYQEILTDPSYAGQHVVMTYPLIGNYGVNDDDRESEGPEVTGFVVREAPPRYSSWRATGSLEDYLLECGVVGIAGVDTRALTLHLRTEGAKRGAIAPADTDEAELLESVRAHPLMEGLDLACGVSTETPYEVAAVGEERFHVLAYDFGVKAHSPRLLAERGCRVTVIPAETPVDEILSQQPDGLFVSNGPGDPSAVEQAQEAILGLSERDVPVFGICLGHQLIARAFGAQTYKLPFGHQPRRKLQSQFSR